MMNKKITIILITFSIITGYVFCAPTVTRHEVGVDEKGAKVFIDIEKDGEKIISETEIDENGKKIKVYNFTQYDADGYPTSAEIYDAEGRYILKLNINYTEEGKIGFSMTADNIGDTNNEGSGSAAKFIEKVYYDNQYIKRRGDLLRKKADKIKQNMEKKRPASVETQLVTVKLNIMDKPKSYKDTITAEIITDGMRETSGADIAFYNSEKIAGSLQIGENNYGDIKKLTGEESLYIAEMSGSEIIKLIGEALVSDKDYLNYSGITTEFFNGALQNVVVQGDSIDIDKLYTVAVNSFVAKGEGIFGYMAGRKITADTGIKIYDTTAAKLNKIKVLDNKYPLELRNKNIKK